MAPGEQKRERRKQKRYNAGGGAFALLKWNGAEVLGAINDISTGGLCISHIDNDEDLEGLSGISINLMSEKISHEDLIGRSIWSTEEDNGYSTSMVNMKRRGIGFGPLSDAMQLQLEGFIASLDTK